MPDPVNLLVKGGLVYYENGSVVGDGLLNKIVEANGFIYLEQLVQKYAGQTIKIDDNLEIIQMP